MNIILNGKSVETANEKLKDFLEGEGYEFPCGGKGVCGKCRVIAAGLAATERDTTFLSADEIAQGVRLSCDKTLIDGLELDCKLNKKSKPLKLGDCDIIAILGDETILIGVLNKELIDSVVLQREGGTAAQSVQKTRAVRSLIAHEAIAFFERYGVAHAGTIFVFATEAMNLALTGRQSVELAAETVPASLFDLPAEEVYLAPGGNAIDYLKKLEMPETTLIERAVRVGVDVRFRTKL